MDGSPNWGSLIEGGMKLTRKLFVCLAALGLVMSLMGVAIGAQRQQQDDRKFLGNDGQISSAVETGLHPEEADGGATKDQHGPLEGHLPAARKNVKLISKLRLTETEGGVSDVNYGKGYAYLGAYFPECDETGVGGGVHVVDVRDPQNPEKVFFIPSPPGNYVSEGVDFFTANTAAGRRDLLLMSNEICPGAGGAAGDGGINIWDVTNPRLPVMLAEHEGDGVDESTDPPTPYGYVNTVHSVMGWNDDGRSYAVLVDNEELLDVDILDITNPAAPVLITETGLPEWPGAEVNGFGGTTFHHDMWVKRIDGTWYMMVSYWDAGQVLLNVENPENPVFIDDQNFPAPDQFGFTPPEGNAHQGTWSQDNEFFISTNEDFSPYRLDFRITTGPNQGGYLAGEFGGGKQIASLPGETLSGPTIYGGYGCSVDNQIPPASTIPDSEVGPDEERILVLSRGPVQDPNAPYAACTFQEKMDNAQAAGYDAVIIYNHHVGADGGGSPDSPVCGSGTNPNIVAVCIGHRAGHLLANETPSYEIPYDLGDPDDNEPNPGQRGEDVRGATVFDGWGDVRLLNANTLEEIDAYAVEEAKDERFASGFGALSVHEVKTDQRKDSKLGYLSYYSAGLRVIRSDNRGIKEMGMFIDKGGNDFWGIFPIKRGAKRPLLLLSDRDLGLYILKYTGPEPGELVSSGACKGRKLGSRTDRAVGSGQVIVGTEGNDVLTGTTGNDIICGLGGDDVIDGKGGGDEIVGNAGNDTISGGNGKDTIRGGSGRDAIDGNDGNDVILGGADNDTLRGNGGWDTLRGGRGRDTLQGGDGNDVLRGGADNDTLKGYAGDDKLNGDGGTDTCDGGGGRNTLRSCER